MVGSIDFTGHELQNGGPLDLSEASMYQNCDFRSLFLLKTFKIRTSFKFCFILTVSY